MTLPPAAPAHRTPNSLLRNALRVAGAADVLVVTQDAAGRLGVPFGLVAGEPWDGTIDLRLADEPLLRQCLLGSSVVRSSPRRPRRVLGPYVAAQATLVPGSSGRGVRAVVFGGLARQPTDDQARRAAQLAARALSARPGDDAAESVADERELALLQALAELMTPRDRSLREAMTSVAAGARAAAGADGAILRLTGEELAETVVTEGVVLEEPARRHRVVLGELGELVLVFADPALKPSITNRRAQRVGRAVALVLQAAGEREALRDEVRRVRRQATTDELTGLRNRRGWNEEVDARMLGRGPGASCAVIALDVDGLKAVNDRLGHAAGDDLLREVAAAISSSVRSSDVAARVGGDEFLVLVAADAPGAAAEILSRLDGALARAGWAQGRGPSVSTGWAVAEHPARIPSAVAAADAMLYERRGR